MAIPKSTIVMAVVVCVPFGFAVRSSLEADDEEKAIAELEKFGDDQARKAEAEERERAAAEALDDEKRKQLATEALRELYGAEPATFGSAFDGIKLGGPDVSSEQRARLTELEDKIGFSIDGQVLGGKLVAVTAISEDCTTLEGQLIRVWGEGENNEMEDRHWVHPIQQQRATLAHEGDDECWLLFEPYATVDQWFNKTRTSVVPLWALGKTRDNLVKMLAERVESDENNEISWQAPGLGHGAGATHLTAAHENGKIIRVVAMTDAVALTVSDLTEHLTKLHGPPAEDEPLTWSRKPPIKLETSETSGDYDIHLTVGKPEE